MRSKSLRGAVISAIVGSMFLATGCLGGKWFDRIVTDALLSGAYELIWDNDAILDFFGDDSPGLIM